MHTLDRQDADDLPTVTWITPTYCRPQTLPNLIACFLAQNYPADKLQLLILDDADQYLGGISGERWDILSIHKRFNSLPAKFNALAGLCSSDIIIVAEDDDSFLPDHTLYHALSLGKSGGFSKPSRVLSDYQCGIGEHKEEASDGRFHGSVAFTRIHWEHVGGWPLSHRADFDQQMMAHFADGVVADPCKYGPPQYVFRWHTNNFHGQSLATGAEDAGWYNRFERTPEKVFTVTPKFDLYTERLYESLGYRKPVEPDAGLAIPGGV